MVRILFYANGYMSADLSNRPENNKASNSLGYLVENLPTFLSDISTRLAATSVAVATTDLPYIPAVLGVALIELISAGQNFRSTLAFARLEEFSTKLQSRISALENETVRSLEFAALCRSAFEKFIRESLEEKRDAIIQYVVSAGSRAWDPIHDHSKILLTIERISPSEYVAFLDIVKAIDAAMQWEMDNRGKLSFQYGIGVILHQLSTLPIQKLALRREITLNVTLRTLSSMNLIYIKDVSIPTLGSASASMEIINVTPLGRQLISYLSPDLAFPNINKDE